MVGGGDSGGNPHLDHGADTPLPTHPVDQVHVLIVRHSNGGESIYGQVVGMMMVNFTTESIERRRQLNNMLVNQGTYEVAKRMGVELFWRVYRVDP